MTRKTSRGGMSNLLYRCSLLETTEIQKNEPRDVLLRIYGPSYGNAEIQLEIFNLLAAEELGPKLYGTFEEGRFEEYLVSSPLSWLEMTSEEVSSVVARKIAAIHKLEVQPLANGSDWLIERYKEYNQFIIGLRGIAPDFTPETLNSTKRIASELLANRYQQEIDYLSRLFVESKSPLVFSHNDLHQNNILLLHHSLDTKCDLNNRIVLIDFEYCSYNYRTFDLANHLSEWCFDYNGDDYPHFQVFPDRFPSEEKQKLFLSHYIDQICDTSRESAPYMIANGKLNRTDKIDRLFEEMQPFLMASNLLWALWAIKSACTSKIRFGYWVSCDQASSQTN